MIAKRISQILRLTNLDVGAGTGILSLFCWKSGAKKVYAVEASDMADVLENVVKENGAQECIKVKKVNLVSAKKISIKIFFCKVIKGNAEKEGLIPEKVDVIVSEWMGFYLLHESMLNSVIAARDLYLKDDGIMLPSHARLLMAPIAESSSWKKELNFWQDVYGFSMKSVQRAVEERSSQRPDVFMIEPSQLLATPEIVAEFDLRWTHLDELQFIKERRFVSLTETTVLRGLCLWFDCDFNPYLNEDFQWTKITLDTSPSAPPTHWKNTVIALPDPVQVEEDEIFGWEITLVPSESNPRNYKIALEVLDPATEEHPVPCLCRMAKCELLRALDAKENDECI